MKVMDLDKYSSAEKIVLAEQLWDSVAKDEIGLSEEVKKELDIRLDNLENGKSELYSWDEVKAHIKKLR